MAAGLPWGARLLSMQRAPPRSQEIPAGFRAPQRSSPRPARLRLQETLLAPKGRGWRATRPPDPSSALHSGALSLNHSPSLCSEGCGGWGTPPGKLGGRGAQPPPGPAGAPSCPVPDDLWLRWRTQNVTRGQSMCSEPAVSALNSRFRFWFLHSLPRTL